MSYAAATINALANLAGAVSTATGAPQRAQEQYEIRKEKRAMVNQYTSLALQSITKFPQQDQLNLEKSGFLGYGTKSLGGFYDHPFQQPLAQRTYGNWVENFEENTLPGLQDLASVGVALKYYSPDNKMVDVIEQKINSEVDKFEDTVVGFFVKNL